VIDGEIQNTLQTENSLGSFSEGSVKYWLLAGTLLELPVNKAANDPELGSQKS
jgi:hypothetical protein